MVNTIDTLEALKSALENDRIDEVVEQIDILAQVNERDRGVESGNTRVATEVRTRSEPESEIFNSAQEYLEAVQTQSERRIALDRVLAQYLIDEAESEAVIEVIDRAIESKRKFDATRDAFTARKDDLDLSPLLFLTGADSIELAKGTEHTEIYSVHNLGGTATSILEIDVRADIPVRSSLNEVPSLDAEGSKSIEIFISSTESGVFDGQLTVFDDVISERLPITVTCLDKLEFVDRAVTQAEALETSVTSLDRKTKRNLNGLLNQAREIRRRLQRLQDEIGQKQMDDRSINNKIRSISNRLGAFNESVDGVRKAGKLSSRDSIRLRIEAKNITETLTDGKSAGR